VWRTSTAVVIDGLGVDAPVTTQYPQPPKTQMVSQCHRQCATLFRPAIRGHPDLPPSPGPIREASGPGAPSLHTLRRGHRVDHPCVIGHHVIHPTILQDVVATYLREPSWQVQQAVPAGTIEPYDAVILIRHPHLSGDHPPASTSTLAYPDCLATGTDNCDSLAGRGRCYGHPALIVSARCGTAIRRTCPPLCQTSLLSYADI